MTVLLGIVACVLLLSGCASSGTSSGGAGGGNDVISAITSVFDSPGEKQPIVAGLNAKPYSVSSLAVGEQKDLARQRGEGLGFVRVSTLETFLDGIRARLVQASGVSNVPGKMVILANPAFAAYSTPDGNIYIAMGWLPYLDSEDELAAIVAHELSHVLLTHHSADLVAKWEKHGQALHELGVGTQMAVQKTTVVSKGDQRALLAVQLLTQVAEKVVLPAWGRRQEQEADLLAIDLMIRTGYSPGALISMLEKYRAWEKVTTESAEDLQRRVADAAKQDAGKALSMLIGRAIDEISASHPDTGQRMDGAADYIDRHYSAVLIVEPKMASWNAVKGRPDVLEISRNYDIAFSARTLLERGKPADAYTYAKATVNGRTSKDAYPNWILAKTAMANGRSSEAIAALQKAIGANEPIRQVYDEMIFVQERAGNIDAALDWTDKATAAFGNAERWTPTKVRLLRKSGRDKEAGALALKCTVEAPDWRRMCLEANKTPIGRTTGG